jgi:hypothetical protein
MDERALVFLRQTKKMKTGLLTITKYWRCGSIGINKFLNTFSKVTDTTLVARFFFG